MLTSLCVAGESGGSAKKKGKKDTGGEEKDNDEVTKSPVKAELDSGDEELV